MLPARWSPPCGLKLLVVRGRSETWETGRERYDRSKIIALTRLLHTSARIARDWSQSDARIKMREVWQNVYRAHSWSADGAQIELQTSLPWWNNVNLSGFAEIGSITLQGSRRLLRSRWSLLTFRRSDFHLMIHNFLLSPVARGKSRQETVK